MSGSSFARSVLVLPKKADQLILIPCLLFLVLLSIPFVQGGECQRSYSLSVPEAAVQTHANKNKLIIAHRGASFYLPEHTIPAYRLGLEMGADFIEPDLVASSDGHLIAMHTADLTVTTDVTEVFADRNPWFSPFMNQSGYWTFNFTLEEIKTLKVKQRLPRARSTAYDGMFSVPTLLEIQQLLRQWNDERIPQLLLHPNDNGANNGTAEEMPPHHHYPQYAGIYPELKASPWFAADANMDLVDLFLDELASNEELFSNVLECPPTSKFDQYIVPPMVVQSFEGDVLHELHDKWKTHRVTQDAPMPPMILLANVHSCWEDPFWFDVGEKWRQVIQGIGMAKECFPKLGENTEEGKGAFDRAKEFDLVIHPYTERPEHEFLLPGFQDEFEEMQYLFCTIGVQGIFTESINMAILAARMECPSEDNGAAAESSAQNDAQNSANTHATTSTSSTSSFCWQDTSHAALYIGFASFIIGVFMTVVISVWFKRGMGLGMRPPRQQRVPIDSVDEPDGVVFDQIDSEML